MIGWPALCSNISRQHHGPRRRRDGAARRPAVHAATVVGARRASTSLWCVDDFTEENGAHTHRARQPPAEPHADAATIERADTVALEAPAGTMIVVRGPRVAPHREQPHGRPSARRHLRLVHRPDLPDAGELVPLARPDVVRYASDDLLVLFGYKARVSAWSTASRRAEAAASTGAAVEPGEHRFWALYRPGNSANRRSYDGPVGGVGTERRRHRHQGPHLVDPHGAQRDRRRQRGAAQTGVAAARPTCSMVRSITSAWIWHHSADTDPPPITRMGSSATAGEPLDRLVQPAVVVGHALEHGAHQVGACRRERHVVEPGAGLAVGRRACARRPATA